MSYLKNKRYVIQFISLSLLFLSLIWLLIYLPIHNYNSNRIYDLRAVPQRYRASLLEEFLVKQYTPNSILLIGDSQANGYRYPTDMVFSTLLAKKLHKKVINAAFRGERIQDNIYTLTLAKKHHMHFDTIIYNADPSHPREPSLHYINWKDNLNYKIGILKASNIFAQFSLKFNPTTAPNDDIHRYKNLDHYLDMNQTALNRYLKDLKKLISLSKSISKNVIIYYTPHCPSEVKRLKLNTKAATMFRNSVEKICKENNVTFLNPQIVEEKYYKDIVHLNSKGHIKMANILYNTIQKNH